MSGLNMAPSSKEKIQPYGDLLITLDLCHPARENNPTFAGLTRTPDVGFFSLPAVPLPTVQGLTECLITQYDVCTRWLKSGDPFYSKWCESAGIWDPLVLAYT